MISNHEHCIHYYFYCCVAYGRLEEIYYQNIQNANKNVTLR